MKVLKYTIALLFVWQISAQDKNLNNYYFVVVPEQFSILGEKNQYQLNEMTKFYLEKKGFKAYYPLEVPNGEKCDALYADVDQLQGFMGTKLQFVLSDCEGREVFRSIEGRTKVKEYERAYPDALRQALVSLPTVRMKDIEKKTSATPVASNVKPETSDLMASSQSFERGGISYLLRKTGDGYSLYKEEESGDLKLIGKLVKFDSELKYLDAEGNSGNAEFDAKGNLILKTAEKEQTYLLRN